MNVINRTIGLVTLACVVAACSFGAAPAAPTATPAGETLVATPTPAAEEAITTTETTTDTATLTDTTAVTDTTTMTDSAATTATTELTATETVTAPATEITATEEISAAATTGDLALPPEDEASARLQVPEGFAVRIFASGIGTPRLMTVGPDGILYVADIDGNRVVRLPDADNDGLADEVQVIAEDLPGVHSVEWFNDWLYVAEGAQIERLKDEDGDGVFELRVLVTDNIPDPVHHRTRTLHFGPDGMLYVTTGSSSNNDPETDPRRAAMLRFNADGSIPDDNPFISDLNDQRHAIWAEGLRNSIDFLFLDDGRLLANQNGSDLLGDDVPPEEVVIEVEGGKHYGWPYCYTPTLGVVPDDEVEVHDERVPFDPAILPDCSTVVPGLFTDLAHQAPIGMVQYKATAFPAEYQGNIFEAYHGSWNSTAPRDCKVQMIVLSDGTPTEGQPFLTGFRDDEAQACGDAWGRPAGLAVGTNGELFVSDDQNGNVYRVIYVGE